MRFSFAFALAALSSTVLASPLEPRTIVQIRPYKISVPESAIIKLKAKLSDAITSFPDELEGANWDLGSPLADVKRIAKYWREKFNWRDVEKKLNALPNYMATIPVDGFDDVDVHFIHVKSQRKNAIPLVFLHGWPGTNHEVLKLLPLLAAAERAGGPAFDIVAPSYPNFGFSGGVKKVGFGIEQHIESIHRLMLGLGYERYVAQGGDAGAIFARALAIAHPESLLAIHLNTLNPSPPPNFDPATANLTEYERAGLERSNWFRNSGMGYFHIQTTKPQTLGYGLADSPVALLAWIYEKLHDWSDAYPWTEEEVCEWVSLYWFSRAGPAASVRLYYEAVRGKYTLLQSDVYHKGTKLGFATFPKEIGVFPQSWSTSMGDTIVLESLWTKGGHFAATERPDAITQDLVKMFGRGGGAEGVVRGRSGL